MTGVHAIISPERVVVNVRVDSFKNNGFLSDARTNDTSRMRTPPRFDDVTVKRDKWHIKSAQASVCTRLVSIITLETAAVIKLFNVITSKEIKTVCFTIKI